MIAFYQKNGKKVYVNPKYVAFIEEIKPDITEIYFVATESVVSRSVDVNMPVDEVAELLRGDY